MYSKDLETPEPSEPTYIRTYFSVDDITSDISLLAPGYLFIDPVHGATKIGLGGLQSGPQIRETDGTLIWYGGSLDAFGGEGEDVNIDALPRVRVQDFHVCDYRGTKGTHLCWSERAGAENRKKVVLDESYELVRTLTTSWTYDVGNGTQDTEYSNMHEFNMVDDGESYLQPAWPQRRLDLTVLGGPEDGYIWDGCFQEVIVSSGEIEFSWCWMDHFPIWETNLYPNGGPNITGNITSPKAGRGTAKSPYDAWHVNSLDKNSEGDYLLSTRHGDQILKIAGNSNVHNFKPGTPLWRLGGKGSNIDVRGEPFIFSKQHGVRYVSSTADETIFSILDNAWEGALQPTADCSSGMIISVNNATKKARLIRRYPNPKNAVAPSQGSMQIMPNKNAFIAWGSRSQFSEFTEDGQLLFHASYTNEIFGSEDYYSFSYRIWKSPWIGKPVWDPKLVAFSRTCSRRTSPLVAYVSWNGATEVASFRFYVSNDPQGPWFSAGETKRTGFETVANLSNELIAYALGHLTFPRYVSVEALDASGQMLPYGEAFTETFVPRTIIRDKWCDDYGCFAGQAFDYDVNLSVANVCGRNMTPQYVVLIIIIVAIEVLSSFLERLCLCLGSAAADRGMSVRLQSYDVGNGATVKGFKKPHGNGRARGDRIRRIRGRIR